MNSENNNILSALKERTLIVGNLGYIGPVLTNYLNKINKNLELIGFDNAYFQGCLINPYESTEHKLSHQIFNDVRSVCIDQFKAIDNVIYLAAISNDPMGNKYEVPTHQINSTSAIKFAEYAKLNGVKRFIYASSCSVYGAGGDIEKNELSELNPLTSYAKSKIDFEIKAKSLANEDFIVTCLRFATACGASPRLRLDLVLNDFVASALLNNKIEILSDGSPWRPLIDVEDMCKAIYWAMQRTGTENNGFLSINIGFDDWNYTIKDLALAVKDILKNVKIEMNSDSAPDKRSYRVDFSLYKSLAPQNQLHKTIDTTISELINNIENSQFRIKDFRNSHLIRLNTLNYLRENNIINSNLNWN